MDTEKLKFERDKTMATKAEHCENCGKVIGELEQAYLYEGRVACHQCNEALRHPTYITQTKSVSGLGIAALVLGLIACLGCWIPMCGIFSLPFAILGTLFGAIGIIIAKLKKRSYIGLPIAGTIVCVTAAFIVIAVTGATVSSIEESSRVISKGLEQSETALSTEVGHVRDSTTTVHYTVGEDEFSAKQYYQVSLTTSETASATLFITAYSDSTAEIQLATHSTMFPNDTTEGFEGMEISVTYKFSNNTEANRSYWLMNIMKYHNAWYQGDSAKFILEAIPSDRLSLKLDKTGDVYRFDLEEAHQYLRKLRNVLQ